ncbi:MAG: GAF domain-containing protein [Anaerolineales bacterium]|nr:GAF domain-containing protein [Chloroflexota bacterium]MBL6979728.1 GAF domain-containing protein [Anaerolineales bacterium]
MSSFFNKMLESGNVSQVSGILFWRERILNTVLLAAAILGGGALIVNVEPAMRTGSILFVIAYVIVYAWLLTITFYRKLDYRLRAGTLLVLLYVVGIFSALQFGSAGDARVWWLGLSLLSAVFFGTRAGVVASVISTGTFLGLGWMMNQYLIAAPDLSTYLDATDLFPWTSTSVPLLTVSILAVLSFGVIINGLTINLNKANQLTDELEEDRLQLQQRTSDLERREVQIRTAAEISRAITAELDPNKIFEQVVSLIKERFGLYYVGVFMLDEEEQFAVLRVGTGDAGKNMIADGHKLAVDGNSMIGWSISNRQARIALDIGEDAVHFQNPHLPSTRSELALPMISEGHALGALTIQSIWPEAFDQDDITVLQGIADSLATSIHNANLFNQVQENLNEINTLHRQYLAKSWEDVIAREGETDYTLERSSLEIGAAPDTQLVTLEVPLVLRDQVIGTISIERKQNALTEEEESFVNSIASQAALALENARLVKETERSAQHNRSLTEITSKIWTSTSVDAILRTALQELGRTLGASEGTIQLNISGQRENTN